MHAAMKILFIGNAENLQKKLCETLETPCTRDASRICYMETANHEQLKEELLKEFADKHEGKLPKCMQNN